MVSLKKLSKSKLKTSEPDCFLNQIRLALAPLLNQDHPTRPTLLVAYSGGLDSTVLLHALYQLQSAIDDIAHTEFKFNLKAMHVHHGLSPNADDWADYCEQFCIKRAIPFEKKQVNIQQDSGLGIEATAREARYQALNAAKADFICLAHHQDDQAETLLLQLARGAGVKGLASMATIDLKRRLLRPLLGMPKSALMQYAQSHQLQWIEDESNADTRYDRNFIRHTLLPTFDQRYASIRKTLARSATHIAEANTLLDELAVIDATSTLNQQHQTVNIEQLKRLSLARQRNLIRFWLTSNGLSLPNTALLHQILQQLTTAKLDALVKIKVTEELYVMRYQGLAYLVPAPKRLASINLLWQGEESVLLPNLTRLIFTKAMGKGFAYQRGGSDIKLRIKNREGGEYFKPTLGRPKRALKTMMQSSQIPPWQRSQLPLIFMDETLVIIPNIGVYADMQAASHELGLSVTWEPNV